MNHYTKSITKKKKIYRGGDIKSQYGTGKEKFLSGYLRKMKIRIKIKYQMFKINHLKTVK